MTGVQTCALPICRDDFLVFVVFFDEVKRDTDLIFLGDADQFIADVEIAFAKGLRPVAVDICEDEDADYRSLDIYYLENPTFENEAIIAGMFDLPIMNLN